MAAKNQDIFSTIALKGRTREKSQRDSISRVLQQREKGSFAIIAKNQATAQMTARTRT